MAFFLSLPVDLIVGERWFIELGLIYCGIYWFWLAQAENKNGSLLWGGVGSWSWHLFESGPGFC
jgi:hypothetical protein